MSDGALSESSAPALAFYRLQADETVPNRSGSEIKRQDELWSEPILRQNAIWFCHLRWVVVAVLGGVGLFGFLPQSVAVLDLWITSFWPLTTAIFLILTNTFFVYWTRRLPTLKRMASLQRLLWTQITTDLLVLTAVIHWLGQGMPAAPFMYLFHIILACIVFPPGQSLLVAVLAAVFYLGSLWLECQGVLTRMSVVSSLAGAEPLRHFGQSSLMYRIGPMLLTWAVIWHLVSRLSGTLRRRERQLAATNLRLQASSQERAIHMLQTTHQLKAPFAAIHAQTQLLLGQYCGELPAAARSVVEKMSARCLALSRQIQEMLQLANLRSQGQTAPERRELDLGLLTEEAISRVEPAARQRSIRIEREVESVMVTAVADHLTMLLDNLLVNAVTYSHPEGLVQVTCRGQDSGCAVLVVRDHGIGIPKDKLPHIFDDYYRTDEAAQHNRSSTGLGLAIVRQVARKAGVQIQVESAPGWGTRFTVDVPGRITHSNNTTQLLTKQAHGLSANR